MTTTFVCMQCQSTSSSPFMRNCKDYFLNKPFIVNYYRCNACGLIQQTPVPGDVKPFYENYPVHKRKSSVFRLVRTWVMSACYFNTKSMAEKGDPTLLIDFGCGDGWFLDANRGRCSKLVGYEVDQGLADHLSKELQMPIYGNEVDLLRDCEGRADVVTMHFVLEHLTDINHTFGVVCRLLKPGGIFYFSVPNISSWEARIFGKKWHNLDAPRHISFPESRSIHQLAERWGFKVVQRRSVPFPNGVAGSMPVVIFGRFRFSIFLIFLPLGILLSRLFPSGNSAYLLRKLPEGNTVDTSPVSL